ncbi:carbohydrate-binding protein [Chitinibacter sp. GC72]|uniref:carbohydrate-binding protein n=1 Tax=Chitinibacter sp. GC72 TaxID=1526917 RepID=UPI0012F8EFDE|nr:carbohydrate-binding protein [Chitinibacter sp. GC72]
MSNINLNKKLSRSKGFTLIENMVAALVLSGGLLAVAKMQSNLYQSTSYSRDLTEAQIVSQWKIEELRKMVYTAITTGNDIKTLSNTNFTRTWTVTDNADYKNITLVTTWKDQNNISRNATFFTRISRWAQVGSLDMHFLEQEVSVTPYPPLPTPVPTTSGNNTPAPSSVNTTPIPKPTPPEFISGDSFTFGNYSVRSLVLGDSTGRSIKCTLEGFDTNGASIKSNVQTLLQGTCAQQTDVNSDNSFQVQYTCGLTRKDTSVAKLKGGCSLFDQFGLVVSSACGVVNLSQTNVNETIQFDFTLDSNGDNSGLANCNGNIPTPAPTVTPVPTTTSIPTATPVPSTTSIPTATPVVSCTIQTWSGSNVKYTKNSEVSYSGKVYKSLQTHNSQSNWDPVSVPSLWGYVRVCP